MTIGRQIAHIASRLEPISDAPRFEAELLTAKALGVERISPLQKGEKLTEACLKTLEALVEARLGRVPLQYVLGEWQFMGLEFCVGPEALIPRQDTETLCEAALGLIKERGYKTALDICTGTGCIAISLKKLGGLKSVSASDISPECVRLARKNAQKNGVTVDISVCDLFEGHGRFDLITANPPYISRADMQSLQKEVAFEPALALYGGEDGLDFYRRIAADWHEHINPGGAMLLEVGAGEAGAVAALFAGHRTELVSDLNGIERVVTVYESK